MRIRQVYRISMGYPLKHFPFAGPAFLLFLLFFIYHPGYADTLKKAEPENHVSLKDEFGNPAGTIRISDYFKESPFQVEQVQVDGGELLHQINAVLDYFKAYRNKDAAVLHSGVLGAYGVTLEQIEDTLRFTAHSIAHDLKKKRKLRILDPHFLQKHYRAYRWLPVNPPNTDLGQISGKIKITTYAVFEIFGSYRKEDPFLYPLYALPYDEAGMTAEEAQKQSQRLNRFRYSKQEVLAGAYDRGGAEPLVWLTRDGLEEALMEGSISVSFPDGKRKFFNVDRNNGIGYDWTLKTRYEQKRYWYFAEVAHPLGYGVEVHSKLPIYPGVVFAGDVYNMGLGKLLAVGFAQKNSAKKRFGLAVLGDTGGAFTPNLRQLDYYGGICRTRIEFEKLVKSQPEEADVYILLKKK